ncbi:sulfotransferase family 2 domain-containing protein [Marinobacter sp. ATCH36]|uniref:sulfotransferase family 2 domain-containing protein n=1 Tax=Marinobacter sp. ATCH36 TaxID=2945106 RepID=UPI002022291B|nr:sulfotransferase family 2 domain-containing protein [Marinobacter sp. ATCH36]MCL7945134.1 sulfotransferase family protein [Marinobacter sp. ATCH36]
MKEGAAFQMLPIFFVHIPKTAGTSFRKSAENYFGSGNVVYDYSLKSSETSELVTEFIYENKDPFVFDQIFEQHSYSFLSGHVHAIKYVHLFGVSQTVTFLRDPIQRVMSEYNHFVRNYNYEGDFPSFYRKPGFINRLSKLLHHVPLESIGMLGLTEDYQVSLDILNDTYSSKIEYSVMNMGRQDREQNYQIPQEQLDELHGLNQQDIELYGRGVRIFNQRKQLFDDKLPFVHGTIQSVNKKSVQGWAWFADKRIPVEIDVFLNEKKCATVKATDLRPGLLQLGPPRKGYVGFHLNFPTPVDPGTLVSAVVAETGQVLAEVEFSDA